MRLLKSVSPDRIVASASERWGHSFRSFPLSSNYELFPRPIGEGGVNRVFFLESKLADQGSWVLKLPKLAQNSPLEYGRAQRAEYLEIKQKFFSLPDLVLDEHYFVMEGRNGEPLWLFYRSIKGILRIFLKRLSLMVWSKCSVKTSLFETI
jgi:hypothetical protein